MIKEVQATWYLKEETSQPVGRISEFEEARRPMDVVGEINETYRRSRINSFMFSRKR